MPDILGIDADAFSDADDKSGWEPAPEAWGFNPVPEMPDVEPGAEHVEYDKPDPKYIKPPRKPRGALEYEKKAHNVLQFALTFTAPNRNTVADAAAIVMYGDNIEKAAGNLAVHDARVAAMIDWLGEGSDSPYMAMVTAMAPFVLQIIRNHEPVLEPAPRGIKIPFTKGKTIKLPIKLGVRLGRLRGNTHEPQKLTDYVFGDPAIAKAMSDAGIMVYAGNSPR